MTKVPTHLQLHTRSRTVDIQYDDSTYTLTGEYLRVHSPSAEVRGHGVGQEVLQVGKRDVAVTRIEPSGQYGLKLVFSDGHDSGIYAWDYLYELCTQHDSKWQDYLERLHKAGASRVKDATVVKIQP